MRIAIAGGHGKIGQRLIPRLIEGGHEVRSLDRKPEYGDDLRALGAEPVVCDLESASEEEVAAAVGSVDAMIFSAGAGPGSGPERKSTMDYGGAVKLIQAAKANGDRPLPDGQLGRRRPRRRRRRHVRRLPARQGQGRRRASGERARPHDRPPAWPHRRPRDRVRRARCRASTAGRSRATTSPRSWPHRSAPRTRSARPLRPARGDAGRGGDRIAVEASTAPLPDTLRLGAIELAVTDLDRAVEFYEGLIGLRVTERDGDLARLMSGERRRPRPRGPARRPTPGPSRRALPRAAPLPEPRGARADRRAAGHDPDADPGRVRPRHPRGDLPRRP